MAMQGSLSVHVPHIWILGFVSLIIVAKALARHDNQVLGPYRECEYQPLGHKGKKLQISQAWVEGPSLFILAALFSFPSLKLSQL